MQKLPHAKAHVNCPSPTCPYAVQEKKNGVVLVNLNLGGFKIRQALNVKIAPSRKRRAFW
jgi:hypothetical protein